MASRLIAQLLVGAAQVVVRAFGQAYREAAASEFWDRGREGEGLELHVLDGRSLL